MQADKQRHSQAFLAWVSGAEAALCLRALVTNLLCAKNVRRKGDFYE